MRPARRGAVRPTRRKAPVKKAKKAWCPASLKTLERHEERIVTIKYYGTFHGETSARGKIRCPSCGRRLTPRIVFCIGGEYAGQKIPKHKEK